MKILSAELENELVVEYRKEGALISHGTASILVTDAQLKIIRDTIRENGKSNGVVESKEKEK